MGGKDAGVSSLGTVGAFLNGRACSDTLFHVLNNRAYGHPLKAEEHAAVLFAGGIMQHGRQCGMIWGATLAAGAQAFRLFGPGPRAEAAAITAAQRIVESFRDQNGNVNCVDITGIDRTSTTRQMVTYFLLKGGAVGCFRMAGRYAPVAWGEINAALSQKTEAPSPPASCASLLAKQMSGSNMHAVMTAGLAGGIGLSGGACGALGAAIWIFGMKRLGERTGTIDYRDSGALRMIEVFLKSSGQEFECSRIAGRRFGDVNDHAAYLREGGCANILEALTRQ